MVTIKHKQTGKTEIISINLWQQRYNQELWDVLEIKDAVDLFSFINGQWMFHNTVELNDALSAIEASPNQLKYENSPLNTSAVKVKKHKYTVDELLKKAEQGIILLVEDSTDDFDEAVDFALEKGFLKQEGQHICRITSLGREVLSSGGYEPWKDSKKSRGEKVTELLKAIKSNGYYSISKETPDSIRETITYASAKNLIYYEDGQYVLGSDGYDILDWGFDVWVKSKQSSSPLSSIHHYYGPTVKDSTVNASNISQNEINGSTNATITSNHNNSPKESEKFDWKKWLQWLIAIVAGGFAIWKGILEHFFLRDK